MNTEAKDLGHVSLHTGNGVATVEFFHPLSNSLPGKLLNKLADTISSFDGHPDIRVIVLRSGGDRAFCAGASFDELAAIDDLQTGKEFFSGFAKVINACRKSDKLIIGRVQGKAVGGGVGVASATDYCFATRHASVKLSELAVGIGPFVVGPAVARKIGQAAMSQLAINATEWKSAEWACEKGLYAEIFDTVEELDQAVNALAQKLSNSNPEAMRMLKAVFWEGTGNWDELLAERAAMSGKLVLSDFTKNAIAGFKAGAR
jgi:methylglutaconyl-CoA hydratase